MDLLSPDVMQESSGVDVCLSVRLLAFFKGYCEKKYDDISENTNLVF